MPVSIFFLMVFSLPALSEPLSDFEFKLSTDDAFFIQSKNYRGKYTNDDGSISIVGPQFSDPGGNGNLMFSAWNDRDGLCALYGLGRYVKSSMLKDEKKSKKSHKFVQVNPKGKFRQFVWRKTAVESFSCEPKGGYPSDVVSSNYKKKQPLDDGSTTIIGPRFSMNGKPHLISWSRSLANRDYYQGVHDGLCKLYGLGPAIRGSITDAQIRGWHLDVSINPTGRFNHWIRSAMTVKSFACEQKPKVSRSKTKKEPRKGILVD